MWFIMSEDAHLFFYEILKAMIPITVAILRICWDYDSMLRIIGK